MKVGIVGHEGAKFTAEKKEEAIELIRCILRDSNASVMVSGGCHLGGIDIWAEDVAKHLGIPLEVHVPKSLSWEAGYKPRNLLIAQSSDVVHCIVVREYPKDYKGMRFDYCYHCKTGDHIKSGGCWTAKKAKQGIWHIL